MTFYKGTEVDVRISATLANIENTTPITHVDHIEWHVGQGRSKAPEGMGSRLQRIKEGLLDFTGNLKRKYDETLYDTTKTFPELVGAYGVGTLPPLYIHVKNKTTAAVVVLKLAKGDYDRSGDVDGFVAETYDFDFEEISFS